MVAIVIERDRFLKFVFVTPTGQDMLLFGLWFYFFDEGVETIKQETDCQI